MRIVPTIVMALCALPLGAAAGPGPAGRAILAIHNQERAALNIPALTWNDRLMADAANWARQLAESGQFRHSTDRKGAGENLWIGTHGGYTATDMAKAWAGEKAHFKYGAWPDVSRDKAVVGHYTQMIWRGTREIGCAIARTDKWDVLVCRYSPAGNMAGQKPY